MDSERQDPIDETPVVDLLVQAQQRADSRIKEIDDTIERLTHERAELVAIRYPQPKAKRKDAGGTHRKRKQADAPQTTETTA
jgi:hypothetical protein